MHLHWCHGDSVNAQASFESKTFVEVARITAVHSVFSKTKPDRLFSVMLSPGNESKNGANYESITFDVAAMSSTALDGSEGKSGSSPTSALKIRDNWVTALTMLLNQELRYKLSWSPRDAGCQIWVHWHLLAPLTYWHWLS